MAGFVDWTFRSRETGRITVAQFPNPALWIAAAAWVALALAPSGHATAALRCVSQTALAIWAVDELARGVNPWRRVLGFVTLLILAVPILL